MMPPRQRPARPVRRLIGRATALAVWLGALLLCLSPGAMAQGMGFGMGMGLGMGVGMGGGGMGMGFGMGGGGTPVPELDPSAMVSAIAVLIGGALLITGMSVRRSFREET